MLGGGWAGPVCRTESLNDAVITEGQLPMSLKSKVSKGTATLPTSPLPLFSGWVLPAHALSTSAVGLSLATTASSLSPNGISTYTTLLLLATWVLEAALSPVSS